MSPRSPGAGWPDERGEAREAGRAEADQQQEGFVGTYWYHSHVGTQAQTANGPIIVEPKNQGGCPLEYDEELVMMTNDYYHVCPTSATAARLMPVHGVQACCVRCWRGAGLELEINDTCTTAQGAKASPHPPLTR